MQCLGVGWQASGVDTHAHKWSAASLCMYVFCLGSKLPGFDGRY